MVCLNLNVSDWVKRDNQLIGHVATPAKWEIILKGMLILHSTVTNAMQSYNSDIAPNLMQFVKLARKHDTVSFLRTRNGRARLCIKFAENTIEWLQHHTSFRQTTHSINIDGKHT
jgi:hypothetical protein